MGFDGGDDFSDNRQLHAVVHEGVVEGLRPVPHLQGGYVSAVEGLTSQGRKWEMTEGGKFTDVVSVA